MTQMARLENNPSLEGRVRSWLWWDPVDTTLGSARTIHGVARGLGLSGLQLIIVRQGWVRAEVAGVTFEDPSPLVAALMVCWLAVSRAGRTPPPELDDLVADALSRGVFEARAFGVEWAEVEALYPGRSVPVEVLARATVALALRDATSPQPCVWGSEP